MVTSHCNPCLIQYCCPRQKSLSSKTNLQVLVLVLELEVLVLGPQVLVLVLEP